MFLYSVNLTEYVVIDPRVSVCVSVCVCVCVCVCVSVRLWTFLNARPDRTRGPIFIKFGTRTKMLIRYGLPEVLWDASIL